MNDQCSLSELQLMLLVDDSDVFRFVWLTLCYVCLLENLLAMFSGIRWRWCLTTGIRRLWEDWLMTQCTDKCFHFFICVLFAEDHWQNRTFLLFFCLFCFVRAIPPCPFFPHLYATWVQTNDLVNLMGEFMCARRISCARVSVCGDIYIHIRHWCCGCQFVYYIILFLFHLLSTTGMLLCQFTLYELRTK